MDPQLAALVGFSQEDWLHNQQGHLSPRQYQLLSRRQRWMPLYLALASAFGVGLLFLILDTSLLTLVGFSLFAGLAAFFLARYKLPSRPPESYALSYHEGPVKTFRSADPHASRWHQMIQIDTLSFSVNAAVIDYLRHNPDQIYRLYFEAESSLLLSIGPLSTPLK